MVAVEVAPSHAEIPIQQLVKHVDLAVDHLMEGKRHLLVKDYPTAVSSLALACEFLASKHGETANECADAYFHYGKALLELGRMESGVLGNALEGVPDCEDESSENIESPEKMTEDEREDVGVKVMEALEENFETHEEKINRLVSGHTKLDCEDDVGEEVDEVMEEASKDEAMDSDKIEEDPSNLQRAWEMLELAKLIYSKMVASLTDSSVHIENIRRVCDTLLLLGEVSIENENYTQAVEDLTSCLEKRKDKLPEDVREMAETQYQLGVALGYHCQFDEAVKYFNDSIKALNDLLQTLKEDNGGSARVSEIDELEKLLPEIHDKIQDTIATKEEASTAKKIKGDEGSSGFSNDSDKPVSTIETKKK